MEKEKCCEKCERHIFGYPDYGNWCKNKDCHCHSLQKESEWESTLEYALPDRLTDDEKQIIRNNVSLIISNREK